MSDTKSLTYHELAAWRGISLASARKYAQKKRWPRTLGNDGQARILVPVEALPATLPEAAVVATDVGTPDPTHVYTRELETRIEGLLEIVASEKRHAEAQAQRADAEARRADAAETDRDAWKTQAQRGFWQRLIG